MGRLQQRLGVVDIRNADYQKPADSHFALYEALVSSSAAMGVCLNLRSTWAPYYFHRPVRL